MGGGRRGLLLRRRNHHVVLYERLGAYPDHGRLVGMTANNKTTSNELI